MKILIVSDTHGRDEGIEQAIEAERPFDMLIHCGDVEGREYYIEALADTDCCIIAGNNDYFADLDRETELFLLGHRIFVTHGHSYGVSMDIAGLVEEAVYRECEIALFGHTHKPLIVKRDGVLAINPGSLSYPRQNGRRPSYIVMELRENETPEAEIKYL
ncbi:MAG: metallophosphoesterase [Blautia sp.]|nr:metallophosphoesterase [Blautia sp.]